MSYDNIAGRSVEIAFTDQLYGLAAIDHAGSLAEYATVAAWAGRGLSQFTLLSLDLMVLVGCLETFAALVFQLLAFVCDMTAGHGLPVGQYFGALIFSYAFTFSITWSYGISVFVCVVFAILHAASVRDAWKACLRASRDFRMSVPWGRNGISSLFCHPFFHIVIQPVFLFCLANHQQLYPWLPENFGPGVDSIFKTIILPISIFFAILSLGQRNLTRTAHDMNLDREAQAELIGKVSHRALFLDKMYFAGRSCWERKNI
jgi:hypothetical protein